MTAYQVTSKREVPMTETSVGIFSRKSVTTNLVHGGEKAVIVKLESGYMACGFGDSFEAAEQDAVKNAMAIEAA